MVGTIICKVIIIMCYIITINVKFYLLKVLYSQGITYRITLENSPEGKIWNTFSFLF